MIKNVSEKKKILYILELEIKIEFNLYYKLEYLKFKIVPASFIYIYDLLNVKQQSQPNNLSYWVEMVL